MKKKTIAIRKNLTKIWLVFIFSCVLFAGLKIEGAEIRAVINETEAIRTTLHQQGAAYKGDYGFIDHIYRHANQSNLNDEFVRIRQYIKTNWQQKSVVIIHKIRDAHEGNHQTLLKEECETVEEAGQFIPRDFGFQFSFSRQGWEYGFNHMRIFVEEIEGLPPSIEVLAATHQQVLDLFADLNITQILTDSVPEWYYKQFFSQPQNKQ